MIVDGERVKTALGIKGATKYGATRDYSTRMAYEIVDAIDDAVISESELLREQGRPKGKWIGIGYDGYADGNPVYNEWECSNCGHEIKTEDTPPYCEICGARME